MFNKLILCIMIGCLVCSVGCGGGGGSGNADPSSSAYAQLGATVKSLKFYEGGRDNVPMEAREYDDFQQTDTRFVFFELTLEYPQPGKSVAFSLDFICYKANGAQFSKITANFTIQPEWIRSIHTSGYGWDAPGNWPAGSYTLKVYDTQNKTLIATGTFTINDGDDDVSGIEIDLNRGGDASGPNGVRLEVLEGSGAKTVEVVFGDHDMSHDPVEDGVAVSDEYTITMKNLERGDIAIPLKLYLPVNTSGLPEPLDEYAFAAEWFNPETGKWEKIDGMAEYDPACACVAFLTNHLSKYRVVYMGIDPETQSRAILYTTDRFHITYFGPKIFGETSAFFPKTTGWSGSGTAGNPEVPAYIEDLGKALEVALTYHTTKIKTPEGNLLFEDPTHENSSFPDGVIPVKVTKLPDKGDSRLGGPVRISSQLKDWHEMKAVAAHELIHVLADQHYTGVGARMNRWFFEAMAELWATRAAGYTPRECVDYFSKRLDHYLKVSLDASDEDSYYAAGDLLAWIEEDVGAPVAAGTVALDDWWDVNGLDKVLKKSGTNLSERYMEYVLESTVGDHYPRADQIIERVVLNDKTLYKSVEFKQPTLSARFFRVISNSNADGLLVAETKRQFYDKLTTYSYTQTDSIITRFEDSLEAQTPETQPLVVKHFGKETTPDVEYSVLRQVTINPNITESVTGEIYFYNYYLLVPPTIKTLAAGKATWEYPDAYGKEGASKIKGFDVWVDGTKLTNTPVPFAKREYADSNIKADSDVIVKVVDIYGNEWPDKDTGPYLESAAPDPAERENTVTIKGRSLGASQGASKLYLDAKEMSQIISWNNDQIVFTLPNDAVPGKVKVIVNGMVSNEIQLNIKESDGTITRTFSKTECTRYYSNECTNHIIINGGWTLTGTGITIESSPNEHSTNIYVPKGTSGTLTISATAAFDSDTGEEWWMQRRHVITYHTKFAGVDSEYSHPNPNEYPAVKSITGCSDTITLEYEFPMDSYQSIYLNAAFEVRFDDEIYDRNGNLVESFKNILNGVHYGHTVCVWAR